MKLKSLFICVCRPPITTAQEQKQALYDIEKEIEMAQANNKYDIIVTGGYFNFSNLEQEENIPKIELNMSSQEKDFELYVDILLI